MSYQFYSFLHIAAMFLFVAMTQRALAAPKAREKKPLMITHIMAFIGLVGGFGLIARLSLGWPGWVLVKVACWLGIMFMPSIVKRKPELAPKLTLATIAMVLIAVAMVVFKPF
jgi:O-antigen/teichoic acid export membrane protein